MIAAILFVVFMVLWLGLGFGIWRWNSDQWYGGGALIVWFLLALLGWAVFGHILRGG